MLRIRKLYFVLAIASSAVAAHDHRNEGIDRSHEGKETALCRRELVLSDRDRVEKLLFGGVRPNVAEFDELTNSYHPESTAGYTDRVEEVYARASWANGRRALWPSFSTFFRKNTDTENVATNLDFIEKAQIVEMCSAFQALEREFPHSQWGRGWVSNELEFRQQDVFPGSFTRYFTDRVYPEDVRLLVQSIERTTQETEDHIKYYIHKLNEGLEIRIYVDEYDQSRHHLVEKRFGDGVFLELRTQAEAYLGRAWGILEWLFGTDALSNVMDSLTRKLETLRQRGVRPVLVEIFHTHPFDSIKVTPHMGNPHIIYPELSHFDRKFFLNVVRRVKSDIPVAISAVSGLGRNRLSKEFYVYYPEPRLELPIFSESPKALGPKM